jgi:hypothetical protein
MTKNDQIDARVCDQTPTCVTSESNCACGPACKCGPTCDCGTTCACNTGSTESAACTCAD